MRRAAIVAGLVLALASGLAAAGPVHASTTAPQVTGYHFPASIISPKGMPDQCLTANKAEGSQQLYVFTCEFSKAGIPIDPLQIWSGYSIYGSLHLELAGHPDVAVAGIPGPHGNVVTIDTGGGTVPVNEALFVLVFGSKTKPGAVNRITNQTREWMALPKRGHNVVWGTATQRFTRGYNESWIIRPGWIAEQEL